MAEQWRRPYKMHGTYPSYKNFSNNYTSLNKPCKFGIFFWAVDLGK
jgi:hypothetical protein